MKIIPSTLILFLFFFFGGVSGSLLGLENIDKKNRIEIESQDNKKITNFWLDYAGLKQSVIYQGPETLSKCFISHIDNKPVCIIIPKEY